MVDNKKFVDKRGRVIVLEGDSDNFIAEHEGSKVGHIALDFDDEGCPYFYALEVQPEFRRAGIATALVKRVVECHGPNVKRPEPFAHFRKKGLRASDHLTVEGGAFLSRCIQTGILKSTS